MPCFRCVSMGALMLSAFVLAAQTPAWIALQGRITVEGKPFQGQGWFKFALVAGSPPSQQVGWYHDGTEAAQAEPATALPLWVTNGLFTVGLGDTTISNMAPLPASWERLPEAQVRVWFSDGLHGWEQLAPDLRLGAVPYALHAGQVPAQSISWGHLTAELQNRLAASNAPPSLPESTLLLASLAQASNLAQMGFAPYPMPVAQAGWQTEYLDPRLTSAFLSAPGTNLWDGEALWLWRWPLPGAAGQGARFDPASGRWQMLASLNAPAFEAGQSWVVACAGDLWLAGMANGTWQAARYPLRGTAWEVVAPPPGLQWPATVHVLSLAGGPVILTAAETALAGAWYDAQANRWVAMDTNGLPLLDWSTAHFAPLTNGWLALGLAAGEVQLWRYQLEPPGWEGLDASGFTLPWSGNLRAVWTGTAWYFLASQEGRWRGLRYEVAGGQWRELPATNAPLAHDAAQFLWTGRELAVVNLSIISTEEHGYSARYDPAANRWQPMNPAAPVSAFGPEPLLLPLPEALLMVRVIDPSRFALYDYAAERWQPLTGPNLGFEALVLWTGAEVLALPYQPPPEEPLLLHRFTPPRRVGWFYRPVP